jgi:hypothetical protein
MDFFARRKVGPLAYFGGSATRDGRNIPVEKSRRAKLDGATIERFMECGRGLLDEIESHYGISKTV